MNSPAAAGWRHLRAAVVAVAIVMLSATGHVLGGGYRPHPLGLAILVAVAMAPVYASGRVQLRLGLLVVLLGVGQIVVHQVLASAGSLAPAAHHTPESLSSTAGATGAGTLSMVAGHAIATLVVAAALAYGEAVLWGVWRWLCSALAVCRPGVVVAFETGKRLLPAAPGPFGSSADVRRASPPRAPPLTAAPTAG